MSSVYIKALLVGVAVFLVRGAIASESDSDSVNVVLAGSSSHYKGLEASVRSLVLNTATPEVLGIHIFQLDVDRYDYGLMKSLQKWTIGKGSTFSLYNFSASEIAPYLNKRLTKKGAGKRLKNPANYVRFILAEKLPQSISRCMYMDTDIIALKDIVPIYRETARSSRVLGAFPRGLQQLPNSTYDKLKEYGVDVADPLPNFNAGLLFINLNLWRVRNISRKSEEVASLNNQLKLWSEFGSQPPLVILLGGSRFEKLNESIFMNNAAYVKLADIPNEHIAFMHWNGKQKPWVPCAGWGKSQSCFNFDVWNQYSSSGID